MAGEKAPRESSTAELQVVLRQRRTRLKQLCEAFPEFLRDPRVTDQYGSPQQKEFHYLTHEIAELSLELAKRGKSAPEPGPESGTDWAMSDPDIVKRRAIVLQNPGISAHDLCRRFDMDAIPLASSRWTEEFEVEKWAKAYEIGKLRPRIETLISKDRKKVG